MRSSHPPSLSGRSSNSRYSAAFPRATLSARDHVVFIRGVKPAPSTAEAMLIFHDNRPGSEVGGMRQAPESRVPCS